MVAPPDDGPGAAGSTSAVQSSPHNNIQGVIDTFAQTVALIEFLFCLVKFFLCLLKLPRSLIKVL